MGLLVKMVEGRGERVSFVFGSLSSRAQVMQTGTRFVKLLPYVEMPIGLLVRNMVQGEEMLCRLWGMCYLAWIEIALKPKCFLLPCWVIASFIKMLVLEKISNF